MVKARNDGNDGSDREGGRECVVGVRVERVMRVGECESGRVEKVSRM